MGRVGSNGALSEIYTGPDTEVTIPKGPTVRQYRCCPYPGATGCSEVPVEFNLRHDRVVAAFWSWTCPSHPTTNALRSVCGGRSSV